jgi:NADPH2 dehydrogenase
MQLWALGRASLGNVLKNEDPSFDVVSSSDIPLAGSKDIPRPLTKDEVKEYVQLYATAASNAVHRAGFDGVEIHGEHNSKKFVKDFLTLLECRRKRIFDRPVSAGC